jgi:YidC/Oxa1 family membrane protein insertase
MDRKSILILIISFVLLVLWYPLTNRIWPPKPAPLRTNQLAAATNQFAGGTNVEPPSANQTNDLTAPSENLVTPGTPEETMVVENEDAIYTFTSHGGALKTVSLKRYPEAIRCWTRKKVAATNRWATLNARSSLPALALLGGEAWQGDGVFRLARMTNGVRAEKELKNGLYLVKEFRLVTNYVVDATFRFENRSTAVLTLPPYQLSVGTATPVGLDDDLNRLGSYWYNGTSAGHMTSSFFSDTTMGCFRRTPPSEYRAGATNVQWAALHNQFFTLAVMPSEPAHQIVVLKTNLPPPGPEELKAMPNAIKKPFGLQVTLVYPGVVLATNQVLQQQIHIYTGPREYQTLARLGARFKNKLEAIMDYGGFFGWFAQLLLSSMNGLYRLGLSYSLAIIAITVIIKLLFWPLTNAGTRSMKRMAALQPQMKALQEKYRDDPTRMQRKMMDFYKEHKINPMGGCLPVMVQMPVFIGFYQMIQSAIELRGARFLWVCDLSKPDTVFFITWFSSLPFPWLQNIPINLLPLVMGTTMLWQARLTPPSPSMDPMQQKMMKYMPLMFLFILYNFSAGLTLYWTVQNLLTIAQMKLTRAKDEPAAGAPKGPPPKSPSPKMLPKKKKP